MNQDRDIEVLLRSALLAGEKIRSIYNSDFKVYYKKKDDPLTEADIQANDVIVETILEHFPDDKIVSEEIPEKPSNYNGRVWIIDPIDGTREFVKKTGQFAVSIGLSIDGVPVKGIVYNPINQELYVGSREYGVCVLTAESLSDIPIKMKYIKYLNQDQNETGATSELPISPTEWDRGLFDEFPLFEKEYSLRKIGSVAYKLGIVSGGSMQLTVSLAPKNDWDICAGQALVYASGGIFLGLPDFTPVLMDGKKKKGLVAGSPIQIEKLREILKKNKVHLFPKRFLKNNSYESTKEN